MSDRGLLLEQLERLAFVLDEIMPLTSDLVREAIALLKEHDSEVKAAYRRGLETGRNMKGE